MRAEPLVGSAVGGRPVRPQGATQRLRDVANVVRALGRAAEPVPGLAGPDDVVAMQRVERDRAVGQVGQRSGDHSARCVERPLPLRAGRGEVGGGEQHEPDVGLRAEPVAGRLVVLADRNRPWAREHPLPAVRRRRELGAQPLQQRVDPFRGVARRRVEARVHPDPRRGMQLGDLRGDRVLDAGACGRLPGERGDALVDEVAAAEPAVPLARGRLAGVELQRDIHAGLRRGRVDLLPEVAEGVLATGVVGQLDGVEGVAEQEPAVVAEHLEHRLQPGGLQLRERGPEPGEVVRDDVAGQPGGHSARYPLPVVARRRIASARSFANRTRSGPRCSVKLRPCRVNTSCRWTPPRSRVSSSGGSGLSATGSEPLSGSGPANRGSSCSRMNGRLK